jgi:Protein of unknown function (DUF1552)
MNRKALSRRAMLRGAGTLLALPMLEAMLPVRSALAADANPRRLICMSLPCGIRMDRFTPATEGANYALTSILQSFAASAGKPSIAGDVSVFTGLANPLARPDGAGDHASGTAALFTCAHPLKTASANIRNGISLDQAAARVLGQGTKIPSLQLGTDGGDGNGDCDSGYACAYPRSISWASPSQPLAKEIDPQSLFDRLFAGQDPSQTAQAIARRKKYRQSVLDSVKSDTAALKKQLGKADLQKLDQYQTGIAELEKRLQFTDNSRQCMSGKKPGGVIDIRDRTANMLEMMALAFQCDLTRVVSFMLQNGGSGYAFDFLGFNEGHHDLSHHGKVADKLDKIEKINQWEIAQFATLVRRLKELKDPDGTSILDNSLVILSSEITDGDAHNHDDMPVLVAGKGGGGFNPGRHVKVAPGTLISNLYLAGLKSLGVNDAKFGDSTGPLANV